MKKVLFALLALVLIAGASFAQTPVNFNLSMTVAKYIEVIPGSPIAFDFGTATHNIYYGAPGNMDLYYPAWGEWNLAYANCGFSATLTGNNGAVQNVPRFAKQEDGVHGGAWDILNTVYQIGFLTNGVVENDAFGYVWGFGASMFPKSANFTETPHNGQIKMRMAAHVNSHWQPDKDAGIPIRETLINPAFTNIQSADAGVYTCTMIVTLAAI